MKLWHLKKYKVMNKNSDNLNYSQTVFVYPGQFDFFQILIESYKWKSNIFASAIYERTIYLRLNSKWKFDWISTIFLFQLRICCPISSELSNLIFYCYTFIFLWYHQFNNRKAINVFLSKLKFFGIFLSVLTISNNLSWIWTIEKYKKITFLINLGTVELIKKIKSSSAWVSFILLSWKKSYSNKRSAGNFSLGNIKEII